MYTGKKDIIKGAWHMLPWVWTVLGTVCSIWYQIVPGKWILDSDVAAEMVLANHLNQTHRILSADWYYSRELRVFESQWFYRIGLLLSPNNWHAARVIAAVLFYLVFIAVIFFFAKSIGLGSYAPWMSAILMWPFGRWYLVYALYGTYYLVYMTFSMAVLGILIRLSGTKPWAALDKNEKLKRIGCYSAGLFCSVGSGLNGVKQTMTFFGPLLLAGMIILFWAGNREKAAMFFELRGGRCRREWLFARNAALFTAGNVLGYLINLKLLSQKYTFVTYGDMYFGEERQKRFYDILLDFLSLFGYTEDCRVLSLRGFASGLGLAFGALLVVCVLRLHRRLPDLDYRTLAVLWTFEAAFLLDGMVYCFIGNYAPYYWLPLIPFAIAVIVLELSTEKISPRYFRNWIFVALAISLPLLSYGSVKKELERPLFATRGFRELTDFLLENGYTEGYASFWNSAVLREMSSDRIQTWTLYSVSEHPYIYFFEWLQEKQKKTTGPQDRCFVVFNEERDGETANSVLAQYGSGELIYEDGPLSVYEFESAGEIDRAVERYLNSR